MMRPGPQRPGTTRAPSSGQSLHGARRVGAPATRHGAGTFIIALTASWLAAAATGTGVAADPVTAPRPAHGYEIRSFEVSGSSRLTPETVQSLLAGATGPDVPIARVRASLLRLQQAYRDAGLPGVSVVLPRQPLTNGVARVVVIEDARRPDPGPGVLPGWVVPSFEIRHFVVHGNAALTAEELDGILSGAAGGATSPEALRLTLARLRGAYVGRGFSNAVVQAPSQVLAGGSLLIRVNEGPNLVAAARDAARTNTPPAPPSFEVRRYDVQGNTLLPVSVIEQTLASAVGERITLPQIQKALGELQLAYRERGWATVGVSLPQQQLTNATVRVLVAEGALSEVLVVGNRHFSSNNVRRSLPSLRTQGPFNSRVFQRELDIANQNRDRQIYPVIGPGPEPGTSALTLRVKDQSPLHGRLDINNQTPPATPEWRINTSVQHRNLWQREHQAGLSYGFSPEAMKLESPTPDFLLNRPQVAFYGGYYRLPFGEPESVEEQIRANRAFGFDEGSRQFRLPPAGARPDLTFFANAASTDTGVQLAPGRVVSQTPLLTIVSRDSGRSLVGIESGGARLAYPIVLDDRRRLGLSAGVEAKHFGLQAFNTNNFIITTVVTNAQGSQTIQSQVASPQPPRQNGATYLPFTVAADFSRSGPRGSTTASLALTANVVGNESDFDRTAYSARASATFGKATLALRHEQLLGADWSVALRGNGQVATGPLLPTEQQPLGGMSSVRGYFEGDDIGDMGWSTGIDLLSPQFAFQVATLASPVPTWLRGFAFVDVGQRFQADGSVTRVDTRTLSSFGFGLTANINNLLDLRAVVGIPLADSPNRQAYSPRANVSLGGQF